MITTGAISPPQTITSEEKKDFIYIIRLSSHYSMSLFTVFSSQDS